jgi:signal transduction histidine kinase
VVVRISDADGRVSFEVTDDGPGFDLASATAGHGYTNMSDRLGAFGGTLTVDSALGHGTTVGGQIPR